MKSKFMKSLVAFVLAAILLCGPILSPVIEAQATGNFLNKANLAILKEDGVDDAVEDEDADIEECSNFYFEVSNGSDYIQSSKPNLCINVYAVYEDEDKNKTEEYLCNLIQGKNETNGVSSLLNYYLPVSMVDQIKEKNPANLSLEIIDFVYKGSGTVKSTGTDWNNWDELFAKKGGKVASFSVSKQKYKIKDTDGSERDARCKDYYESFMTICHMYNGKQQPLVELMNTEEAEAAFNNVTAEYGLSLSGEYLNESPTKLNAGSYYVYIKLHKGYSDLSIPVESSIVKNDKYAKLERSGDVSVDLDDETGVNPNAVISADNDLVSSSDLKVEYIIDSEYSSYVEIDGDGNWKYNKTTNENSIPVKAKVNVENNNNFEEIELSYNLKIIAQEIDVDKLVWYVDSSAVSDNTYSVDYSDGLEIRCELKENNESFATGDVEYSIVEGENECDAVVEILDDGIALVKPSKAGSVEVRAVLDSDKYGSTVDTSTLKIEVSKINADNETAKDITFDPRLDEEVFCLEELSGLKMNIPKGFGNNYTVAIENGTGSASVEKNENENSFNFTAGSAGKVTILVTVEEGSIYYEKTVSKVIEIKKNDAGIEVNDGKSVFVNAGLIAADEDYSIKLPFNVAEIADKTPECNVSCIKGSVIKSVEIDKDEKVIHITFNPKMIGKATITIESQEHEYFNKGKYTFDVEVGFGSISDGYKINGNQSNTDSLWYSSTSGEVCLKAKSSYSVSFKPFDTLWTDEIELEDGKHIIENIYYRDKDGNIYKEEQVTVEAPLYINVDTEAPVIESVKISDSDRSAVNVQEEAYCSNSEHNILVLTVSDTGSGVNSICYKYGEQEKTINLSDVGVTNVDENTVAVSIKLDCAEGIEKINGPISITVADTAGMTADAVTKDIFIKRSKPTFEECSTTYSNGVVHFYAEFKDSAFVADGKNGVSITLNGEALSDDKFVTKLSNGVLGVSFEVTSAGNYRPIISVTDKCGNTLYWNKDGSNPYTIELLDKPANTQLVLKNSDGKVADIFNNTSNTGKKAVLKFNAEHINFENFAVSCTISDVDKNILTEESNTVTSNLNEKIKNKANWEIKDNEYSLDFADCLIFDGKYTLTVTYNGNKYDNGINQGKLFEKGKSFTIDTQPPTNLAYKQVENKADIFISTVFPIISRNNITINMSADDSTAGIDRYEYTIDGTNYYEAEGDTVTLQSEKIAIFNFGFRVYDKAGNVAYYDNKKTEKFDKFVIDKVPPLVSIYGNDAEINSDTNCYEDNAKITVKITEDNPSGTGPVITLERKFSPQAESYSKPDVISATKIDEDTENHIITYQIPDITTPGEYRMTVNYSDAAGNKAKETVVVFYVIKGDSYLFNIVLPSDGAAVYNKDIAANITIESDIYFLPSRLRINCSMTNSSGEITNEDLEKLNDSLNIIVKNKTNWECKNGSWSLKKNKLLSFVDSSRYTLTLSYNNKVKCEKEFILDKTAPTLSYIQLIGGSDVSVGGKSYSIYDNMSSENAAVSFKVFDATSGVSQIRYKLEDELADPSNSSEWIDLELVDNANDTPTSYVISLPSNYTGKLKIEVTDLAGNVMTNFDDNNVYTQSDKTTEMPTIITDTTVPKLSLNIDSNCEEYNGIKYYQDSNFIDIELTEKNYFAEDLNITITNDGKEIPVPKLDEKGNYCYQKHISFTEAGRYHYQISYTDKSTNKSEVYTGDFVVDTDTPVLKVTFMNPDTNTTDENESYVNSDRVVFITIKEKNLAFDSEGFINNLEMFLVTSTYDNEGSNNIKETDLSKICQFEKVDGEDDVYAATAPLKVDYGLNAEFELVAKYTDLAGRTSIDGGIINIDRQLPAITIDRSSLNHSDSADDGYYNGGSSKYSSISIHVTDANMQTVVNAVNNTVLAKNTGFVTVERRYYTNSGKEKILRDYLDISESGITNSSGVSLSTFFLVNSEENKNTYTGFLHFPASYTDEDKIVYNNCDVSIAVKVTDMAYNSTAESEVVCIDDESPTVTINFKDSESGNILEVGENALYSMHGGSLLIYVTDANLTYDKDSATGKEVLKLTENGINATVVFKYHNNSFDENADKDYFDKIVEMNISDLEDVVFTAVSDIPNTYRAELAIPMEYAQVAYHNCNAEVTVELHDRAANNSDTAKGGVIIDTELPKVELHYDNTECSNETDLENKIHSHDVTAELVIAEAYLKNSMGGVNVKATTYDNEGKKVENAKCSVVIYDKTTVNLNNSQETPLDIQFAHTENTDVYKAKLTFCTEKLDIPTYTVFEVSVGIEDLAGNAKASIDNDNGRFTVDKSEPVITETNNIGVKDNQYYNTTVSFMFNVTEPYIDSCYMTVKKRSDDSSEFETVDCPIKKSKVENNVYTYEASLADPADYTVEFTATDKAGNTTSYSTKMFTVDVSNPEVKISFDNNSVLENKYFKAGRTATIEVKDHNFNPTDNKLIVTSSNPSVTYPDTISADSWKQNGNVWTARIEFKEDADYTLSFSCRDYAANENAEIDFANSTGVVKDGVISFTVDKTAPQGSIAVGNWSTDTALRDEYSYSIIAKQSQTIAFTSSDSLSGVAYIEYLITSEVYNRTQLAMNTGWVRYDRSSYSIQLNPNIHFIAYLHIVDRSGNENYISSNGVILDDVDPNVETIAPEVTVKPSQSAENAIFNSDVSFDIKVVDPEKNGTFSGLSRVSYEVINMGSSTASGVLFETSVPMNPKYEKSSAVTVSSSNNSNDITLRITATDMAGNTTTKDYNFSIDITAPTVTLSYDNNSARNGNYFNATRVATIRVQERNFDPSSFDLDIRNSYGSVPSLSGWSRTSDGSGNGDNTVWTATATFSSDGAYTIDMSVTDQAGNSSNGFESEGTAPLNFIIDKTAPVLVVSYNNNNASNGNYFYADRTATINITERNFNSSDVSAAVSAKLNGESFTAPVLNGWSTSGISHNASVVYNKDGDYTFSINYMDMAGNPVEAVYTDNFHIDKTKAAITINGVENNTSYNGRVEPVITITDNNYNANSVVITLTGASKGSIGDINSMIKRNSLSNGIVISFNNFAENKDMDDIYTLSVSHTDMAGNKSSSNVTFSVNRFGSTYEFNEATISLNNKYINKNKVEDIVITEVNVSELTSHTVTIYRDGRAITLTEGVDYSFKCVKDGNWYKYVYTIFASNFSEDGIYSIQISSMDKAGNVAENTLDTKVKNLTFAVDNTPPEIFVTNIASGTTYPVASIDANIVASDNIQIALVEVYLDGNKVESWDESYLTEAEQNNESLKYVILGNSASAHNMRLVCVDKADNQTEVELNKFYVTTNIFVRIFSNRTAVFIIIASVVLILAVVTFIMVKKRRKK